MTRYISSSVKVKIIYGMNDTKKYMKLLDLIDIFLLPYEKNQYLYSGSGFIIDALLLEKPIIHSNGIAMKDLTAFQNTIPFENKTEFPIAVLKIIDNYQEKRADRRDKRGVKKGEGTLDASGNYVPTDANSKFNKKTQFIRNKSDKYQNQSKCTPGSVTVNKDGSTTTCP